ncbi:MAG: redoxin domain-containing protein [Planctomycetes bacterium]|nr:redoxin domain-containing protein [Planctomycetota bacterium]
MVVDYRTAGIGILAIGTDTAAGARRSLDDLPPTERFTFPMLSDRKLRAFREWRAFDDFERLPLHGVYLLDADGRIRWQDTGWWPFDAPAWLLAESRRLLARTPR